MLESTERERVVGIATVEKDKALEVERRNIQEVIRERVMVERCRGRRTTEDQRY